MPEIDLYKIPEFDPEHVASILFGNQSIKDNSPSDYPYTGAWIVPSKKISKTPCYTNTAFVNQEELETSINKIRQMVAEGKLLIHPGSGLLVAPKKLDRTPSWTCPASVDTSPSRDVLFQQSNLLELRGAQIP